MADNRVIQVVLKAVDQMSAVVKNVNKSVDGFKSKLGDLGKEAKDLLSNKLIQGIGLAGVIKFLKDSWDQADQFEASLRKLAGTAKITGTPIETLQAIAQKGRDQFKLSTIQANDYSVELVKLASKAGDVAKAGPGLEAFLNIGAARGLTAADTLLAVKQSILGIDEGTDKLFNKNPSVLYKEYADSIGTAAGKLTDQQKAQALLNAAIEDGSKVSDQYAAYLKSNLGLQEQAAIKLQDAKIALGEATTGLRGLLLPALAATADGFKDFIQWIQEGAVNIGAFFNRLPDTVTKQFGLILVAIANFIGESRPLLTIFGDSLTDLADKVGAKGVKLVRDSSENIRTVNELRDAALKEIQASAKVSEDALTQTTKTGGDDRKKLTEDQSKELQKLNEDLAVKLLQIEQGLTEAQAREMVHRTEVLTGKTKVLVTNLTDAYQKIDEANLLLAAGFDQDVIPSVKRTEVTFGDLQGGLQEAQGTAEGTKGALESVGGSDVTDAVGAMRGILHEVGGEAENAANQALTLAQNLISAQGNPLALVGAIGTVAGLFSSLFGESAADRAQRIMNDNTRAVDDNTRRIGDLISLNTPGRTVAGTIGAIQSGLSQVNSTTPIWDVAATFDKAFTAFGLSESDVQDLLKKSGITINTDSSASYIATMQQFLAYLQGLEPGTFGQDYSSQIQFLRSGLTTGAISQGGEFGFLANLASGQGASGITDILSQFDVPTAGGRSGAIAALQQLVRDLNVPGKVSAAQLGGLTGSQFLDLLTQLLGILTDSNRSISDFTLPISGGGGDVTVPYTPGSGGEPGSSTPTTPGGFAADLASAFSDALAGPDFSEALATPLGESVDLLGKISTGIDRLGDGLLGPEGSAGPSGVVNVTVNVTAGTVGDATVAAAEQLDRLLADRFFARGLSNGSAART